VVTADAPLTHPGRVVPLIIASDYSNMTDVEGKYRRTLFAQSSKTSSHSSFDDQLEDIHEEEEDEETTEVVSQQATTMGPPKESEEVPNVLQKRESLPPHEDGGHPLLSRHDSHGSSQSSGEPELLGESVDKRSLSLSSSVDGHPGGSYHSTFRDSLADNPLAPKIVMGPSSLIVMWGETVNLRVKIWSDEDSGVNVQWTKLVRVQKDFYILDKVR